MSDDDPDSLSTTPTFSAFSFTGGTPPFITKHRRPTSTLSTETLTDFSSSPSFSTPFDVTSTPTLTQTDDPSMTDAFSSGTLGTPTPTTGDSDSLLPSSTDSSSYLTLPADSSSNTVSSLGSSISIDSSTSFVLSDLSSPTDSPYPFSSTSSFSDDPLSTLSFISYDSPFTTGFSSASGTSFMTDSFPTSSSSFTSDSFSIFDSSSTTDSLSSFDSTLTTPALPPTTSLTSSLSSTPLTSIPTSAPSPTPVPTPTPSPTPTQSTPPVSPSSSSSSRSSPSSVTTTSFPSFGGGGANQTATSSTSPGAIVAAVTGAIALAIILALLAILCRRRHLKKVRGRAGPDHFHGLDLDGEIVTVNQPLIFDDGPGPGGAVYVDPYTDDSQLRTQSQSRSLSVGTTGPRTSLTRSNNSFQAVVGAVPVPVDYYNQQRPIDRRSPPIIVSPSGIVKSRSFQSLAQVQTQLSPDPPIARQSSPSFDAGAVAYIRNNDPGQGPSLPSPIHSPGNGEDPRLTTAFSVASEWSPQYSTPGPPPNIDEMWRNSPDPIKASASYRPPLDRRRSFTLDVGGHVHEPDDSVVISPVNMGIQSPIQGPMGPGPNVSNQHIFRGGNYASPPSPIPEVTEVPHSQEGSNGSGGTWNSNKSVASSLSSPVVMTAARIQLTPTAPSLVTPRSGSTGSQYSTHSMGPTNQLPPIPSPPLPSPSLLPVQPLALGKKRSLQGPA